MQRNVCFLLVMIGAALCGCGTSLEYIPLNAAPRPPVARSADSVELFTTGKPDRPFIEVGTIEAKQASAYSQDGASAIISKMRAHAGARGCDGLVILGANDETQVSGSSFNGSGSVNSHTLKGYRGTCIMFREVASQ